MMPGRIPKWHYLTGALVFHVTAYDEKQKIGEGQHERFIVQLKQFLDRMNA